MWVGYINFSKILALCAIISGGRTGCRQLSVVQKTMMTMAMLSLVSIVLFQRHDGLRIMLSALPKPLCFLV